MTIELPRPAPEKGSPNPAARESPVISQLFVDPTARHMLTTTNTGDTFYLPISPGNPAVQSRRPRPLRLRQTITSVAWSPNSVSAEPDQPAAKVDAVTPPTTDILLGTSTGQLLSLVLPPQDDIFKAVSIGMSKPTERDLQTVYTLSDPKPITGVAFGFWSAPASGAKKGDRRAWVAFTTTERMYEVQGAVGTAVTSKAGAWAEEVFKPVRDGTPSESCPGELLLTVPEFQELPGNVPTSQLRLYLPSSQNTTSATLPPPSALAWLTGELYPQELAVDNLAAGLYTSPIASASSVEILEKPSLVTFPTSDDDRPFFSRSTTTPSFPLSVVISQYHWLLLYETRLVAISRETEKTVWEESISIVCSIIRAVSRSLQGADEQVLGLSADPVSRTFWLYTSQSIYEILVRIEDRDVWRAKLEKQDFAEALRFARVCYSPVEHVVEELIIDPGPAGYRPIEARRLALRREPVHPGRSVLRKIVEELRIRRPPLPRCR